MKTRRASPSPVFARRWGAGAAAAFGSGALRLRGGAFALRRSVGTAASATRAAAARVAGSTRAAAASAGASARRGAGAACARGAASVRDTLVFVKEAAHAEEVLEGVRAALTSTKAFLLENPDVTWNARVPPLLAARAGAARGLGWFKVLEGAQPPDARGPGAETARRGVSFFSVFFFSFSRVPASAFRRDGLGTTCTTTGSSGWLTRHSPAPFAPSTYGAGSTLSRFWIST